MPVSFDAITPLPSPQEQMQRAQRVAERQQRQLRVADERRSQLLDVAWLLWQEEGSAGFNMRQLAQRAGYTAGALYAYFPGRESILGALQERLLQELSERVEEVKVASRTDRVARSRREALAHMSRTLFLERSVAWWTALGRDRPRLQLVLHACLSTAGSDEAGVQERADGWQGALSQALHACQEALEASGLPKDVAQQLHEEVLAFGLGLLVLQAGGRAEPVAGLELPFLQTVQRWLDWALVHAGEASAGATDQGDLFS